MNSVTVFPVDDHAAVREYVREVLEVTGLLVLEAAHATAALAIAANARSSIDLLLTDVDMPGIDGIELARRVRLLRPETRVSYVSGSNRDEVASRGHPIPDGELIAKPFGVDVSAEWVCEAVGAAHPLGSFGWSAFDGRA